MSSSCGLPARAGLLLVAFLAAPLPTRGETTSPLLAIGDIHGEIRGFSSILAEAGWIDPQLRWVADASVLVQTGDFLDRGSEVAKVMDLLMDLQGQAAAAGGRAIVLLGNHEAMNLAAAYRDVGPEAYSHFVTDRSEERRREAFKEFKSFVRMRARERGAPAPRIDKDVWMTAHSPGFLEYHESLRADGRYGKWLRTLSAVAQVGDTVLVHGGLSPAFAESTVEAINRGVREEIERFDREREYLLGEGLILSFFDLGQILAYLRDAVGARSSSAGDAGESDPTLDRWRESLAWLESMTTESLLFREDGPLWFRGWTNWEDAQLEGYLPATLERLGARRVVAAHTPFMGEIQARYDGRIFLIDTGMLKSFYPGGRASALELKDGGITALYPGERVVLQEPVPAVTATIASLAAAQTILPSDVAGSPQSAGARGARVLLGLDDRPLPFRSDEEVLEFLRTAAVLEVEELGQGTTKPKRLLLEKDGIQARAIFHDVDIQENNALITGQGFVGDFRDRWANQVAAYEVARLLGLEYVPPTVERSIDGTEGSVGLWIENSMTEGDRIAGEIALANSTRWRRRFYDMRIFDNVIHNIDRNQGNILYDSNEWMWLIDHTRSFGRATKLHDSKRVVACSRSLKAALEALDFATALPRLRPYLSATEVKAMLKRRDRVLKLIADQVASRGEGSVLFNYLEVEPVDP